MSLSVLYRLLDNKSLHLAYLKKLKNYANSDSINSNFLIECLMQLKNFHMKNDKNKAIKYYNQALKYAFNYKNLMFIVRIYKDIISDFNKNLIDMTQLEKYLLLLFNHKEIISGNSYLKNELNNIFLDVVLNSYLNNNCINIIKRLKEI